VTLERALVLVVLALWFLLCSWYGSALLDG
jgi:hypothetical protein